MIPRCVHLARSDPSMISPGGPERYQAAFKDQLQGDGREVAAFTANVTLDVLKELGLEAATPITQWYLINLA